MDKLLLLSPTEMQSSIAAGLTPAAVPVWQDADNVVFAELGVRALRGQAPVFTPPDLIRGMKQGRSGDNLRLYVGTQNKVYNHEVAAGIATDTELLTWTTASDYVNLETWGTWLVMNNGLDPVQVWKNGGVSAPLAATPFTWAKIILRRSPHLLAFNTSNGVDMYEWSHFSDIEQWDASDPALDAGNLTIRDLESGIVAAVPLGGRIAAYGSASMSVINYLGQPNIFGHNPGPRGIGALSPKSVVAQGQLNYGFMQNGVFMTDGNSYGWIDDPIMTKWLRQTCNWEMGKYVWGFHDDLLRVVHWFFLDDDLKWHNLVFHYDAKMLTKGNFQATAAAERESWEVPLIAAANREVGLWQQGSMFNGATVAWSIESKPLDFGERSVAKIVQLIRADGEWDASIRLKVGCVRRPTDAVEWYHDEPLVNENYFPVEREEVYHKIQIYGEAPALLTGLEFFGKVGGLAL